MGGWRTWSVGLVRRAARVDTNHAEVVEAFRRQGYLVLSLASHGRGVPDLLIFRPDTGLRLVEVKRDNKATLTKDQLAFIRQGWPVEVVTDASE